MGRKNKETNIYYMKSSSKALSTIRAKLDNLIQDLLHYVEFSELDVVRAHSVYKKLKDARIERRLVKEEYESNEIAWEVLKPLKQKMNEISKAQGKCNKIESKLFHKVYTQKAQKESNIADFEKQMESHNKKMKQLVVIK